MSRRLHLVLVSAAAMIQAPARVDVEARDLEAPTRFEANLGQWDSRVRFVGRGRGAPIFITDEGLSVGSMTLALVGTNASAPIGEEELITRSNFFVGSDPARWHANVPNYARVRSRPLPGVDVSWHGDEYDLIVAAGVDARALTVEVRGATESEIASDGSLALRAEGCALVQRAPSVIQRGQTLRTRFVRRDATHFGFAMDDYDPSAAVLIDPVFAYSTYLGGSAADESLAIAVDSSGSVYTAGLTFSTDFPTSGALQSLDGAYDAVVSKLDPSGSALVYATYLGGSGVETAVGLAIDATGNAYVTGTTTSTDFPTYHAAQSALAGSTSNDTFVSVLDASGSALVYSTYLGGTAGEAAGGIAVDGSGNAYITGTTASTDFPTTSGAFQTTYGGSNDAFVTKLTGAGAIAYSTYLGGTAAENGIAVAVSSSGAAYVVGDTRSSDFPTESPLQASLAGSSDAFISALNTAGSGLTYSTYLGGSSVDDASAVAVDAGGAAYVCGFTRSTDFPTLDPFQPAIGKGTDGFVSKLDSTGSSLTYSSYLGGAGEDFVTSIAVDSSGTAYLAGHTTSNDFPLVRPMQVALLGPEDAFVAVVDALGLSLVYSTFVGGTDSDQALAIAVRASDVYVAGWTASSDFPTASPLQSAYGGGTADAFISKIITPNLPQGTPCTIGGACASNHCVDGVCCDVACDSQCEACDVGDHLGACTIIAGTPHGSRKACGGSGACTGTCDGAHATCTFPAPKVSCGATCSNASEIDSLCDGDGGCIAQPPHACGTFACADDGRCSAACTTSADCAPGLACYGSACLPPPVCINDHRSKSSDGTTVDCTPYTCGTSGSCNTTCAATTDCVVGWVCDGNACVLPPYAGGCSCNESNESPPWLAAVLALLGYSTRRRLAKSDQARSTWASRCSARRGGSTRKRPV